jgi:adenylate cyclase
MDTRKHSPIDLLVYCMNVAAKITFLTAPNKISIGENIYELLHAKIQLEYQGLTNLNEKETEIH